jgi:hypothetical protein
MKVRVWTNGSGGFGVAISPRDGALCFDRGWQSVLVEVAGETEEYPLTEKFWTTCPELRGRGIQRWIRQQGLDTWPRGSRPVLRLEPIGPRRFQLQR